MTDLQVKSLIRSLKSLLDASEKSRNELARLREKTEATETLYQMYNVQSNAYRTALELVKVANSESTED